MQDLQRRYKVELLKLIIIFYFSRSYIISLRNSFLVKDIFVFMASALSSSNHHLYILRYIVYLVQGMVTNGLTFCESYINSLQ
jgi:putative flippase GtrA